MGSWTASTGLDIQSRLTYCSDLLLSWGRNFLNTFKKDIDDIKQHITKLRTKEDAESVEQLNDLKNQLTNLLVQQEIYWKQMAKTFWLCDEDSNTKIFHASAFGRKKSNKIQKLKDDGGRWVNDTSELCNIAKNYFDDLFSASVGVYDAVLSGIQQHVTSKDNDFLLWPFHIDEFKTAVFQMHPVKSPGPAFYQKFWHVIGDDVFRACLEWINRSEFPAKLNDANIILIPKKDTPEAMKDLRPISLSNVIYRILTKILAN